MVIVVGVVVVVHVVIYSCNIKSGVLSRVFSNLGSLLLILHLPPSFCLVVSP